MITGENSIIQKSSEWDPAEGQRALEDPPSPLVNDAVRLTCWLTPADGGLFPHAVIPLSPVPPAPGATCAGQPLLGQQPYE